MAGDGHTRAPPLVRRNGVSRRAVPPRMDNARRARRLITAVVLIALAGAIALVSLRWPYGHATRPRGAAPVPGSARSDGAEPILACRPPAEPRRAAADALAADVNGDGCPDLVFHKGRTLTLLRPHQRYVVGRRGDQLLLGDWDCDGTDTAGLYRPSTGQVFLFNRWAAPGTNLVSVPSRDTGVRGGIADAARGPDDCDRIEVRPGGQQAPAADGDAGS